MENYRFTFNMNQIGRKISQLRKERNMTQMELADKLGISFQAVSNWERGNTMPDIGKLPELAGIFQVTTDEILGESSGLVNSAIKGEMEKYIEENQVTVREFAQTAPLLSPAQAEAGFEKLTDDKPLPKISEIEDILPFIGRDLVDELALKYADSPDWKDMDELAPFVSGSVLAKIAEKRVAQGKSIDDIAPFLGAEQIGEFALAYEAASNWGCLEDILPFLSRQVLEQIVDRQAEAGEYGFIEDCVPFLAQETVIRLALDAYEKKGVRGVEDFMPFLPQETRQAIAQREYEKGGVRNLEDIAPFLDKGYLNGLASQVLEKEGIKAIGSIAAFLDENMLSQFIREKYL